MTVPSFDVGYVLVLVVVALLAAFVARATMPSPKLDLPTLESVGGLTPQKVDTAYTVAALLRLPNTVAEGLAAEDALKAAAIEDGEATLKRLAAQIVDAKVGMAADAARREVLAKLRAQLPATAT